MSDKIAFIDMDGVLCDFFTAALNAHNRHDLAKEWPAGERDMPKVLGLTPKEFWSVIDSRPFWASLAPYPWASNLIDRVRQLGYRPVVLSAIPMNSSAASGKVRWIHRHLRSVDGFTFRDYILTAAPKSLFGAAGRILIDDYELNCNGFEDAGGRSVLFPAQWNCLHGVRDQYDFAMAHLESLRTDSVKRPKLRRKELATA